MIEARTLLAAALALPLGLLLACLSSGVRKRMLSLLAVAPVPALATALLAAHDVPLALGTTRLRLTFVLDTPGAILLGVAAMLWIASGAYASEWSLLSMYLLLVAVVTLRARGLFGKKSVLEA